ncbi:hypothetical protein HMPREF1548_00050 [Clostridium sp. KLE 1755]|nr:hypothetical protein HMPREF1548_00050 [Clostridium sp. KLE 1755]
MRSISIYRPPCQLLRCSRISSGAVLKIALEILYHTGSNSSIINRYK